MRREIGGGTDAISIHPPRVGRDVANGDSGFIIRISIHPPRVGRDPSAAAFFQQRYEISIHPPRVGRDGGVAICQMI